MIPLPLDLLDEEERTSLLKHLQRPEVYLSGAPGGPPLPNILGLFAHHLRLGGATLAFGEALTNDALLDPRHREILVLRVAWRTTCPYEWAQHVRIGSRVGLSTEQLYGIQHGADAQIWTPLERDLLAATDQMIDRFRVESETWDRLAEQFDSAQLIEVLYVIAWYLCLALIMNSVGLQPDPPTEPIDAPTLERQEI